MLMIIWGLKVENGIVRNWEDMEHLWNYTFYEKMKVRALYMQQCRRVL
jgi:actin-related protein